MNGSIDEIWARIKAHAGEEFTLVRGDVFRYEMFDNYLRPVGRVRHLSRSNFAQALPRVPLQATTDVITNLHVVAEPDIEPNIFVGAVRSFRRGFDRREL